MPAPRAIPAEEVLRSSREWKIADLRALCIEHGLSITTEDGGSKPRVRLVEELVARKAALQEDADRAPGMADAADRLLEACAAGFAAVITSALPGTMRGVPTPAALWALEALAKEAGKTLDASAVARVKVSFKDPDDKEVRMFAVRVDPGSTSYCPMMDALVAVLIGHQALPVEVGRDAAEEAVGVILQLAPQSSTQGLPVPSNPFEAQVRALCDGITKAVAGAPGGSSAGAVGAKYTAAEKALGRQYLEGLDYCMVDEDQAKDSQVALAKASIMNVKGEEAHPLLPVEAHLQPASLVCCKDSKGGWVEDDARELVIDEDGRQVSRPVRAPGSKDPVTLFKATNQVLMYFHTVLVLQYNIKRLPATMSVRSPNVFLHPYYVTRLGKYFAKLVGQDTLGGPAFMEIMTPLMQEAQRQVNFEGASGDQAVRGILEQLPQRISSVAAVRAEQALRAPKRAPDRPEPRDKSKKVKSLDELPKCKTCNGKAGHPSGICHRCRRRGGRGAAAVDAPHGAAAAAAVPAAAAAAAGGGNGG